MEIGLTSVKLGCYLIQYHALWFGDFLLFFTLLLHILRSKKEDCSHGGWPQESLATGRQDCLQGIHKEIMGMGGIAKNCV